MKLEDIIALAKNGYKPGDIKELIALAEENKTDTADTVIEPQPQAEPLTSEQADQPAVQAVDDAQQANVSVLEDKIKELEGKLQQAQQANLDASTAPKKEETAADILADYLQKF